MPESGYYRFTGKDGSLGYKRDALYHLTLGHQGYPVNIIEAVGLTTKPGRPCPYSSVESFERNWSAVSELPD